MSSSRPDAASEGPRNAPPPPAQASDVARMPTPQSESPSSPGIVARSAATVTLTETAILPPDEDELLTLSLRARPSVRWAEGVRDNEGLGRKSSKRCCIFHKQRAFGESSTDSSDYDSDRSGSSSASGGAGGDDGDDEKKSRRSRKHRRIARPKKGKKVPDYQRYHA